MCQGALRGKISVFILFLTLLRIFTSYPKNTGFSKITMVTTTEWQKDDCVLTLVIIIHCLQLQQTRPPVTASQTKRSHLVFPSSYFGSVGL